MSNEKELLERCLKFIETLPYSDAASDLFDDIRRHLCDDIIIICSSDEKVNINLLEENERLKKRIKELEDSPPIEGICGYDY